MSLARYVNFGAYPGGAGGGGASLSGSPLVNAYVEWSGSDTNFVNGTGGESDKGIYEIIFSKPSGSGATGALLDISNLNAFDRYFNFAILGSGQFRVTKRDGGSAVYGARTVTSGYDDGEVHTVRFINLGSGWTIEVDGSPVATTPESNGNVGGSNSPTSSNLVAVNARNNSFTKTTYSAEVHIGSVKVMDTDETLRWGWENPDWTDLAGGGYDGTLTQL